MPMGNTSYSAGMCDMTESAEIQEMECSVDMPPYKTAMRITGVKPTARYSAFLLRPISAAIASATFIPSWHTA